MKVNLEALKEGLVAKGMARDMVESYDEKKLKGFARIMEVEVVEEREEPYIKTHTTKAGKTGQYLVTDSIPYVDAKGEEKNAKGFFIPVEAVDAAIQELLKARGLLDE